MPLPPVFVSHDIYRQAGYGANHPLAIARVGPVMDLCRVLGWLGEGAYRVSPQASEQQLAAFHALDYIRALQRASDSGRVDAETRRRYALGTMENPLFPQLFERAATSVGGSILAAELALEGRVAFHPAGGTHHGRPARASGFCYFNDPVFSILTLLGAGLERVLYVDLDAHHGDGVQDAFAGDGRVFTVSIHEAGRWPHTGEHDTERACNLPVPLHFNDSELDLLIEQVVLPLAVRLSPQGIVITCGADALAGDPLSSMALSNGALWSAVERLVATARGAVVLGGGGYNPWTLARYWTGLWATLSGRAIPDELPSPAREILASLTCDLVDHEEVRDEWFMTLNDERNDGPVRDAVLALAEANHALA